MVLGDQEYSKSYGYDQTPTTAGTAKNWRTQAGWNLSVSLSLHVVSGFLHEGS